MNTLPKLYGASEVAEKLGISVSNLGFIKDLPEPAQRVRASRLWMAKDIDVFAVEFEARRERRKAIAA